MMKMPSKFLAAVVGTALTFGATGSAVAATNPGTDNHSAAAKSLAADLKAVAPTSDHAVAQLLLTGTGPAASAHADVVRLLGFDRIKGRASQQKIDAFVDAFLKGHPNFHRDVVAKIQSGDPYEVRDALVNITTELKGFLNQQRVHVYHAGNSKMMSPDGWWRTVTNGGVAVNVGAVVNGGLYANVAVATEVAVAAAVVWLAGIFLTYKFDPSSTDRLDHDIVVATLARDLRVV